MIPKIIHYAWFGEEMPSKYKKNIETWKNILPDWEFKEWTLENWDYSKYDFAVKMVNSKNWGFLGDPLRYEVIYNYGGVYLDTDMIIKKDLDIFLNNQSFWGFMYDNNLHTGMFGSEKGNPLLRDILKIYENNSDSYESKWLYTKTSNPILTHYFMRKFQYFTLNGKKQNIENLIILPKDYFCYRSFNTNANFAEHQFANSWGNSNTGLTGILRKVFILIFGFTAWGYISASRGKSRARKEGFVVNKER